MDDIMPRLKKVDYIVGEVHYWSCPKCGFPNETNSLMVFAECCKCYQKFVWGKEE